MKRLPQTVYVKWEEHSDPPYLEASENPRDMLSKDDTVILGEYRLVKKTKVSLTMKVEKA